ncbi:hypothetical protein ACFLUB_00300 [Chloroflexota bacterium]
MSGKAESRLIYSSISTSERVANLGVKGALLFTWLITHCDTRGRMPGKPNILKQVVVPFIKEISVEDINTALNLMEEQKLIKCYKDTNGRLLIQVLDWWQWQTGLKYKTASHYEPPNGWEDKLTKRDGNGRFTSEDGPVY